MLVFMFCMQTFAGPIVWLVVSEIFPMTIRGFAMSISIACLWGANTFISSHDAAHYIHEAPAGWLRGRGRPAGGHIRASVPRSWSRVQLPASVPTCQPSWTRPSDPSGLRGGDQEPCTPIVPMLLKRFNTVECAAL